MSGSPVFKPFQGVKQQALTTETRLGFQNHEFGLLWEMAVYFIDRQLPGLSSKGMKKVCIGLTAVQKIPPAVKSL
jgi:hypothetical protein